MRKLFLWVLTFILLSACSVGQTPPQANSATTAAPLQTQPIVDSLTQSVDAAVTVAPAIGSTPTSKPPLAKDAWMQMPVVPTTISDRAREIYQKGLAMGNDSKHFSIIGDCQNVSSYFMSAFDKPGDYSLGTQYTYLQPTINYYQGSFSRVSLAVKGGFNAAAVISPL